MQFPRTPATVIAERIGWTRSLTFLRERVPELRPLYLPADPAGRTKFRPGELAQWALVPARCDPPRERGSTKASGDRRAQWLTAGGGGQD